MAINIPSILSQLESEIVDLAKTTGKNFAKQATADGKQLLSLVETDLVRWTQLLADGQISKAEFELLLKGQKDLIAMSALTQAGLTLAKIDEFKNKVFNLILNTVISLI